MRTLFLFPDSKVASVYKMIRMSANSTSHHALCLYLVH